jgi:hypothetical protein
MSIIKVTTQAELESALKEIGCRIEICAAGIYVVKNSEYDIFSQGSVEFSLVTRESSTGRLETWGSSTGRLETWGSSTGRLETRGSSTGRLETWGSSTGSLVTRESSTGSGIAGKYAATILSILDRSKSGIPGALILPAPDVITPLDWCEYHGAKVEDGMALLYKGVDAEFRSGYGFLYKPGSTPEADDWDGMKRECGGGLHFCSSPSATHEFVSNPEKYVACWVALEDLVVHTNPQYPTKIKGRKICQPIFEVDIDGNRI